jgi:hypothetical protein
MKKSIKHFLYLLMISFSFVACSSDDNSSPDEDDPTDPNPNHRYTYTVTGNGIDGVTFTKEIPYEDHGGGMAYFEPENDYVMVYVYLNNLDPGIYTKFVYLNDVIQPLAINEFNNEDTSTVSIYFHHQGQNYTLESVSGTCVSYFVETFPFGGNSGKSTFKIGFSGTFRNITNPDQTFEITAGEIELYNR